MLKEHMKLVVEKVGLSIGLGMVLIIFVAGGCKSIGSKYYIHADIENTNSTNINDVVKYKTSNKSSINATITIK